jgi:hypothetical protein
MKDAAATLAFLDRQQQASASATKAQSVHSDPLFFPDWTGTGSAFNSRQGYRIHDDEP